LLQPLLKGLADGLKELRGVEYDLQAAIEGT